VGRAAAFARITPGAFFWGLCVGAATPPNCADLYNAFIPGGAHVKADWLNAADYDFVIIRNNIATDGFSVGDLHSDGNVNTPDALIVIQRQNHLRQSRRP